MYTASDESGAEDSDEDIITDYLQSPLDDNGNLDAASAGGSAGAHPSGHATHPSQQQQQQHSVSKKIEEMESLPGAATSAAMASAVRLPSSSADDGRNSAANGVATSAAADGGGSIPIISVTQHSPAASKAFYILGKNKKKQIQLFLPLHSYLMAAPV